MSSRDDMVQFAKAPIDAITAAAFAATLRPLEGCESQPAHTFSIFPDFPGAPEFPTDGLFRVNVGALHNSPSGNSVLINASAAIHPNQLATPLIRQAP